MSFVRTKTHETYVIDITLDKGNDVILNKLKHEVTTNHAVEVDWRVAFLVSRMEREITRLKASYNAIKEDRDSLAWTLEGRNGT